LTEQENKKHKKVTFKQIKKSEDDIFAVDSQTFYVKSSDPSKEPYMIFHEQTEYIDRWLCDCMDFTMKLTDDSKNPNCKHINRVIEKIGKQSPV